MLELADRHDLGSCAARREGSSPSFPIATFLFKKENALKFTKDLLENHQVKITVEIESVQFDQYKQRAARKISNDSKIAGFRPGKAPFDVVKRIYGEEAIDNEAVEMLVNDVYPQIIKEAEIKPSGPGTLEKIESKNPPKFIFLVPLEPEINLGDYHAIRKEYSPSSIDQEDIDKVLHRLQLNFATAESTDHPIQKGDLISIKINAKLTKPVESENPDVLINAPYQMIVGEEYPDQEKFPYEGFEKEIMNLNNGEDKKFSYKYPDNSSYEKLKGKEVEFDVNIQSVKSLKKSEINDDFAKTVGNFETLKALGDSIKKELEDTKTRDYDQNYFHDLIDKIISISTIKYPPQVLEDEIAQVLKTFEQDLAIQNLDLATYLKVNELDKDKFMKEEIEPAAKHQLEHSLILTEINKREKIELEKDELQEEYSQTFQEIQSTLDYKKLLRQFTSKGLADRVLMQAASRLMNKRIHKRLKEIATGEYKPISEIKDEKPESLENSSEK